VGQVELEVDLAIMQVEILEITHQLEQVVQEMLLLVVAAAVLVVMVLMALYLPVVVLVEQEFNQV
jgi:hypothetical protein